MTQPTPRVDGSDTVLIPVAEYERLTAVAEAARAVLASHATRDDETIPNDDWLRRDQEAMEALIAAAGALEAGGRG